MALSHAGKGKALLSRLQALVECTFVGRGCGAQFSAAAGEVDISKWRKLDSRKFGITRSQISLSSHIVLKKLQHAGFEAYLVGGCVRDFLLNKVPKDFDVITTASLKKVKKKFRSAIIVGRRFPICRVTVKGSVVEVSSFETVHKQSGRKQVDISEFPIGCDQKDFARWNNCMQRDFTINSFYYDPFANIIFDYTNAMADMRSLTLRTIVPAHLSFKDDQARILRGLRLAARLGLSFSRDVEAAICNFSSSIAALDRSRIKLEMNYMLSYGAAEPSLLLLKKFKLLDILLPFSAAYLSEQENNGHSLRSSMLMKLFFNLDQLISCDRPCDECLWIALLAFHLALFNKPQSIVVALTFASLLCHGTWEESVKFARQHAPVGRIYVPEILTGFDFLSDDDVAERVANFSTHVKKSVDAFTSKDCLLKTMAKFPEFSCSGLVFSVSERMGQRHKNVFDILAKDDRSLKAYEKGTGGGDEHEIGIMLGKIIINTLVHGANKEITKLRKDVIPPIAPQKKLEVFEEIQDKDTQNMIGSNCKLLPDTDSKARLSGENVVTEDKLSGRSKMTVISQVNEVREDKQDLMKRSSQGVAKKCQEVSSKTKDHLLEDHIHNDDRKLSTCRLQENTISRSGKYEAKVKTGKTVNHDEDHQSSKKHFNLLEVFLSGTTSMVGTHKPKGIYKQLEVADRYESPDRSHRNLSVDEIVADQQIKILTPRANGTLLSSLFN